MFKQHVKWILHPMTSLNFLEKTEHTLPTVNGHLNFESVVKRDHFAKILTNTELFYKPTCSENVQRNVSICTQSHISNKSGIPHTEVHQNTWLKLCYIVPVEITPAYLILLILLFAHSLLSCTTWVCLYNHFCACQKWQFCVYTEQTVLAFCTLGIPYFWPK